jgi:hypothetical protein
MKNHRILLGIALLVVGPLAALAHPGHDEATSYQVAAGAPASGAAAASQNQVSISIEGNYRIIRANGWPDHAPGTFPNRGNPHALASQQYTFRVTLTPQPNATLRSSQGAWFGVALNGVPFEPGTAEFWNGQRAWNYEAQSDFINLGLDAHNAHVQPSGAYHYHGVPTGLLEKLRGATPKMTLVGYGADGFPIYAGLGYAVATNAASELRPLRTSWQLKSGERPGGPGGKYDGKFTADYEYVPGSGDLDETHGRFGVTPEYPAGIYYYFITEEFPQLPRSWRGTPDESFFKRAGGGPGGRNGPPGTGPRRDGPRAPGAPPPRRL